jgi:hypothetical protein
MQKYIYIHIYIICEYLCIDRKRTKSQRGFPSGKIMMVELSLGFKPQEVRIISKGLGKAHQWKMGQTVKL